MKIDPKDLIQFVKDETIQKIFVCILIAVGSFMFGRASVDDCIKSEVCKDIITDRNKLAQQLIDARIECANEKEALTKRLQESFKKECNKSVDESLKNCEFSPKIHCPICIAKGECKKK